MKYDDLKKLAQEGKLTVEKGSPRKRTRTQYKWDKNYTKILSTKKIEFISYRYFARTDDMDKYASYRITHKDYDNLKKSGAKETKLVENKTQLVVE